jgi:hypothetical protein
MGQIFINFRSGDQDMAAAFLYDFLTSNFGEEAVFFSSHSIPAGADFPSDLLQHAERCEVLLALIGPRWTTLADQDGHPLLANPQDWVRREIATALAARRRVVPVLLGNAPRLADQDLPADIAALAHIEYCYLRRRDLAADLAKLQESLMKLIPVLRRKAEPLPEPTNHISASARYSSGSVTGVVVDELNTRHGTLSAMFGNVSAAADVNAGEVTGVRVRKLNRSEQQHGGQERNDPEEWGNARDEHHPPELPA